MNDWIKKNESVLIGGLVPGAIVALASLAAVYSIWVSLAVCVGPFIVVNAFVLFVEYLQSTRSDNEQTFIITLWCKNCHKESDYTLPADTRIFHSSGDGTVIAMKDNNWSEIRCKICKVGSLF